MALWLTYVFLSLFFPLFRCVSIHVRPTSSTYLTPSLFLTASHPAGPNANDKSTWSVKERINNAASGVHNFASFSRLSGHGSY
ncbi:hypothetical protein K435DRAFT_785265 [Dendrothele bispora CBS 962.96]|uniref:Secreted protein n=1 Tax=Dendrothele bispora (strain CBS 962.96) TaxID=1314807 RepID=A0A4S8KXZ1_DENBC|nr:hypothetical protein K435DRAFT_785265 [Dendrothele bispora CBS 962.96]